MNPRHFLLVNYSGRSMPMTYNLFSPVPNYEIFLSHNNQNGDACRKIDVESASHHCFDIDFRLGCDKG